MEKAEAGEGGDADSYQKLRQIYRDIQTGAKAFLTAEYGMCVKFIAVFGFAMIFFVANVDGRWDFKIGALTAFSFVVGGVTSMISGYIGMMIAVFTNARCTMTATLSPDAVAWKESFNVAFRGGAVMGFALSGLGILVLYFLICMYVTVFDVASEAIKLFECVAGFGLGGSAIAMFGRLAEASTLKPRMLAPILPGRLSLVYQRMIPGTQRQSRTMLGTMSAMSRAWDLTFLGPSRRLLAPRSLSRHNLMISCLRDGIR